MAESRRGQCAKCERRTYKGRDLCSYCRQRCPIRACKRCGDEYRGNGSPGRPSAYCSDACRNPPKPPRPARVNIGPAYSRRKLKSCEICDETFRPTCSGQRTCGRLCGQVLRFGGPRSCSLPPRHPVMSIINAPPPVPILPPKACVWCGEPVGPRNRKQTYCSATCRGERWSRRSADKKQDWVPPKVRALECVECGAPFVTKSPTARFCSRPCGAHYGKRLRKGRERGWSSCFTWAEFIGLFIRFDRCCAYCDQRIEGQPEPDHVIPLSRGGPNSITNILPACHICNADKGALPLDGWNTDRARRGKPPVRTTWDSSDPRFMHLILFDYVAA
jgi:hypothetical protein